MSGTDHVVLFTSGVVMSFRFNFTNPETSESTEDEAADSKVEEDSQDGLECREMFEEVENIKQFTDVHIQEYKVCDDVCVQCLDSGQVELRLCEDSTVSSSGTVKAAASHSDLIPNVYEGGLKVWECSVDLLHFLKSEKSLFRDKTVLELGCGAGMPGILAMLFGAEQVHFQDYNPEVIENYTIPNVVLNRGSNCTCKCRYFSGDWDKFCSHLVAHSDNQPRYDVILTAETIYKPENYRKLTDIFKCFLHDTGVVYVAAKSNYFGVGGGTNDFIQFIKKDKILSAEVCHTISEGIPREIIKLKKI